MYVSKYNDIMCVYMYFYSINVNCTASSLYFLCRATFIVNFILMSNLIDMSFVSIVSIFWIDTKGTPPTFNLLIISLINKLLLKVPLFSLCRLKLFDTYTSR